MGEGTTARQGAVTATMKKRRTTTRLARRRLYLPNSLSSQWCIQSWAVLYAEVHMNGFFQTRGKWRAHRADEGRVLARAMMQASVRTRSGGMPRRARTVKLNRTAQPQLPTA